MYAIQDWIVGLTGTDNPRRVWSDLKRVIRESQLYDSIVQLPYVAADQKTYQIDFVNDRGLYLIAQNLRSTKKRLLLTAIKEYLAAAGAFVDLVRREPDTVVQSSTLDPDEAVEAAIEAYRRRGKDDRWIAARLAGKIKREKFTRALQLAVSEYLTQNHYAVATDDIYLGLWNRTAAHLRTELSLSKKDNLRDNQPTLALTYQGLTEEVAAQKLGGQTELSWSQAREIVKAVASLIGIQAQATSRFLNTDLATGKPLLGAGA